MRFPVLALLIPAVLCGCGSPDAANIVLRKQNQNLQLQVDTLDARHERDVAALAACQRSHPTVPTLPPDRLADLFTTHDLKFGTLTGGDNPDSTKKYDSELKVYVETIDDDGMPIKAAGAFTVQAYDLADPKHPLLGTWKFSLKQSRDLFYSRFMLYEYVLPCPWQTIPTHADLTVRVTFDDALTGREFVAQTPAKIRPPTKP